MARSSDRRVISRSRTLPSNNAIIRDDLKPIFERNSKKLLEAIDKNEENLVGEIISDTAYAINRRVTPRSIEKYWEFMPNKKSGKLLRDNLSSFLNFRSNNTIPTALLLAIGKGNANVVDRVAASGADVNRLTEIRTNQDNVRVVITPLFLSYFYSNTDVRECLIKHGANFKNSPDLGGEILFDAVEDGNLGLVKNLIELGAEVNVKEDFDETPLTIAAYNGEFEIAKYLIEHGADVNKKNLFDFGPVEIALEEGHENIARYIIDHCAVNEEEALLRASIYGCFDIVKYLVEERKVDINIEARYTHQTPLHLAILNKGEAVAMFLIEHGANVNKADKAEILLCC